MRTQFILSEAGTGLRRNATMTAAAIITVAISMLLLGTALAVRFGVGRLQHDLLNKIEVSVYLEDPCGATNAVANCLTPADRDNVQRTLQSLPQVDSVTYISAADAYQRFKDDFAGDPDLIKNTPPDALPESFAVKLKDPHQFQVVSSAVGSAPGVQSVVNANQTLKTLFGFFTTLSNVVLAFALILVAAVCLLIYNAMRVAAFSRRRETGIMRLVGASDFSIQAPFVLEATTAGIIGSGVAVLLLVAFRTFISGSVTGSAVLRPFGEWSTWWPVLPVVVAVGVLLSAITSVLTLQRHLRV